MAGRVAAAGGKKGSRVRASRPLLTHAGCRIRCAAGKGLPRCGFRARAGILLSYSILLFAGPDGIGIEANAILQCVRFLFYRRLVIYFVRYNIFYNVSNVNNFNMTFTRLKE